MRHWMGVALLTWLGAPPVFAAGMVKEIAFGQFTDAPSEVDADYYYLRVHGPEIVRLSGSWLRRYVAYRSYDAGANVPSALGLRRGLYGELWFDNLEHYQTRPPLEAVSLPSWQKPGTPEPLKVLQVVSAAPEHLFVPASAEAMQQSAVRWITLVAYPAGVSQEEGDRWFLQTYAPEAARQPGLVRFACSERVNNQKGVNGDWVRMCEYWYRDVAAFRNALIEHPLHYTAPSWGGSYPFVQLASTLIGTVPEGDFLKGIPN